MSRRPAVGGRLRPRTVTTAALAAAASCFTILGWSGLAVDSSGYTRPLVLLAVGVALGGVVLRSLGLPRPVVVTAQALGVAEALHLSWAGELAAAGWWPTAASVREVSATLGRAAEASQQWAAPVPKEVTAFDPLLVLVGAGVVLLVDLVAVTCRRATLAGLPLLAAFTLPVAVTGGMRWEHFVLAAGAFLLLVAAEQLHAVGRWGRPLVAESQDGAPTGPSTTARMLGRNGGALVRVLAPSLLLAVAGSLVVPDGSGFLSGGSGGGDSSDVRIQNPIADLRRDLVLGPDVNLLRVRTSDPDPSYLRISVLDSFDGDTWRPSRRDLPPSQGLDGEMPPPVGLDERVEQRRHRYELETMEELESDWLPLPFPAVAADAPGDWRYDDDTLDVTTTDEDLDTADLLYSAVGLRLTPTARQLVEAPPAPAGISSAGTDLPFEDEVPAWLDGLVTEVTQGADSDFEQAVALQDWFRDTTNFTYSTERPSGNGLQDLETFLGPDGRVGYCEQFASAMAVMARVAGIPARVAVGFLRPDALNPGTWMFSAHDLHSWPELFFAGVGWVRFEPTPADRAPSVPGYTTQQVPRVAEETGPSASASAPSPTRGLRPEDSISSEPDEATERGSSRWWWVPLGLAVAVLLLLGPRLLRARHRRLRADAASRGGARGVEAAWDEVRATALDLGHHWDDGATLRAQQHRLVRLLREAPVGSRASGAAAPAPVDEVRAALEQMVTSLERARFSVAQVPRQRGQEAWASAASVTQALWDRTEPRSARRATWWPRSLRLDGAPGPAAPDGSHDQVGVRLEDNVRV